MYLHQPRWVQIDQDQMWIMLVNMQGMHTNDFMDAFKEH